MKTLRMEIVDFFDPKKWKMLGICFLVAIGLYLFMFLASLAVWVPLHFLFSWLGI